MEQAHFIHCIITHRTPDEWAYVKDVVKREHGVDISGYVPVYLVLSDFDINHDPSFRAADIVSSWWSRGKMPVILLDDENEWILWNSSQKFIIEDASIFIK